MRSSSNALVSPASPPALTPAVPLSLEASVSPPVGKKNVHQLLLHPHLHPGFSESTLKILWVLRTFQKAVVVSLLLAWATGKPHPLFFFEEE